MIQANATAADSIIDHYPSRVDSHARRLPRLEPLPWPGVAGPLDETSCRRYARDGFLSLPRLFSAAEVANLRALVEDLRESMQGQQDQRLILEPDSGSLRSIFEVHELRRELAELFRQPRLLNVARQLLGSEVYLHQSRINFKPGFSGKEFYWHSDFETWHVEDGMPAMRALSCAISLTENTEQNGPLLLIPGSHQQFIACVGRTPERHFEKSLRRQEYGVPAPELLAQLAAEGGIQSITGAAGGAIFFDCNTMHGSNSNITPPPRSNIFVVYNSVHNTLREPYCGLAPRPEFIANRSKYSALRPLADQRN